MRKAIVYSRPDRGVSICTPSSTAMMFMRNGGRWKGCGKDFLDRQIAEQAKYGVGERASRKFVDAMQYGGLTTAEAYGVIRDRFCAHLGTAHELVDFSDLPDRWFRNAWRRSHNGGPIYLDLGASRRIQFFRIKKAVEFENNRRKNDIECFDDLIEFDELYIKNIVLSANTVEELRCVWPKNLVKT